MHSLRSFHSVSLISRATKKPDFPPVVSWLGRRGANSNTIRLNFEVTEELIRSLNYLAYALGGIGVRDSNGSLVYIEE